MCCETTFSSVQIIQGCIEVRELGKKEESKQQRTGGERRGKLAVGSSYDICKHSRNNLAINEKREGWCECAVRSYSPSEYGSGYCGECGGVGYDGHVSCIPSSHDIEKGEGRCDFAARRLGTTRGGPCWKSVYDSRQNAHSYSPWEYDGPSAYGSGYGGERSGVGYDGHVSYIPSTYDNCNPSRNKLAIDEKGEGRCEYAARRLGTTRGVPGWESVYNSRQNAPSYFPSEYGSGYSGEGEVGYDGHTSGIPAS